MTGKLLQAGHRFIACLENDRERFLIALFMNQLGFHYRFSICRFLVDGVIGGRSAADPDCLARVINASRAVVPFTHHPVAVPLQPISDLANRALIPVNGIEQGVMSARPDARVPAHRGTYKSFGRDVWRRIPS